MFIIFVMLFYLINFLRKLKELGHLRKCEYFVHRPELLALHDRLRHASSSAVRTRTGTRTRTGARDHLRELCARARRAPLGPVVHEHEDGGLAWDRRAGWRHGRAHERARRSSRRTRAQVGARARVQVGERHLQRHLILDRHTQLAHHTVRLAHSAHTVILVLVRTYAIGILAKYNSVNNE